MCRYPALAVAALFASSLLLGCASRPTEEALTKSILTATNTPGSTVTLSTDQATCIARELLASDLSDTTLSGLAVNFDAPKVLETEMKRVEPVVVAAAQKCQ